MMSWQTVLRGQDLSWRVGVVLVLAFSVLYGAASQSLTSGGAIGGTALGRGTGSGDSAIKFAMNVTTGTGVSNADVAAIAKQLNQVPGVNELVVMPSNPGQTGEVVSATVNLGENPDTSYADWSAAVKRDVQAYFQGVFSADTAVDEAEVYFLLDGQVVGGAALGRTAYQQTVALASADGDQWVTALTTEPMVTADGANTEWFEIKPASP